MGGAPQITKRQSWHNGGADCTSNRFVFGGVVNHGGKSPGGITCETAQRLMALAAMLDGERDGRGTPAVSQLDPPSKAGGEFEGLFSDFISPGDSLPAHENSALAEHLRGCRSCQAEMAATTAFFRALASDTGPEPSATLLARARMQLDATLDSGGQAGPWTRCMQQLAFTGGRLRAAPGLASALLLLGLLAGGYGGYRAGHAAHMEEQTALLLAPPPPQAPSVVADVSSIRQDPATGIVEVRYDRLVPDMLSAPAGDPSIRELLMAATESGIDPEVRNASVGLLSGCHPGEVCGGASPARNALLNALRTDKAPEVRREALAGLQPFIAEDVEVRDAVLGTLMGDPSASVRIEAVRVLGPVDVDSSVRQVLHTVAYRDGDPQIRSASEAALKALPPVQ